MEVGDLGISLIKVIKWVMMEVPIPMMMIKTRASQRSLRKTTWTMSRGMKVGMMILGIHKPIQVWMRMNLMMMTQKTLRAPMMIHKMISDRLDLTIKMICLPMHFREHLVEQVAHRMKEGRLMSVVLAHKISTLDQALYLPKTFLKVPTIRIET